MAEALDIGYKVVDGVVMVDALSLAGSLEAQADARQTLRSGHDLDKKWDVYMGSSVVTYLAVSSQLRQLVRAQSTPVVATGEGAEGPAQRVWRETVLRSALLRLASMEAFTVGRAVRLPDDEETLARIDYARAILKGLGIPFLPADTGDPEE